MGATGKIEATLSSGKRVVVDLLKISILEYRFAVTKGTDPAESDKIVAKACGMKLKEFQDLPKPDWDRVVDAFFRAANQPVEGYKQVVMKEEQLGEFGVQFGQIVQIVEEPDPNSPSASTSA